MLVTAALPVFLTIALPPPQDRSLSDVWTALGGELKPSLDLVVTAPLVDARVETVGPPVLEDPRIRVGGEAARGRRAKEPDRDSTFEAAVQDESVVAGMAPKPGRVVRLRGTLGP